MDDLAGSSALLTIDLAALRANWRLLADRVAPAECAAVVKADAYGIGLAPAIRALAAEGAELAFSYQGEAFGKRVQPLAASVGSEFLIDVDVTNEESLDACFAEVGRRWGSLDFVMGECDR